MWRDEEKLYRGREAENRAESETTTRRTSDERESKEEPELMSAVNKLKPGHH